MNANLSRRSMFKAAGATAAAAMLPAAAVHASTPTHEEPKSSAGKQGAGFYRFTLGKVEGAVLTDGWFAIDNPHPMVAPEASKDEFEKALRGAMVDPTRLVGEINPLVLNLGGETILIDTGAGPSGLGASSGRTPANLRAAGFAPEQITGIVITHAHSDHVGGLLIDGKPAFPNATIFIGKAEHDFWMGPADMPSSRMPAEQVKAMATSVKTTLTALKDKLQLVAPGDKILGGLDLIDAAGHTPGHLCVAIDAGGDRLFVMGDLVHHHVAMFHNPDWTIAFDTDPKMAAAARKRIFPALAADRALVLAYHLPWPGFGRVGQHGTGYWWAQERWAWGG
jgi:glyoxylase-like metal-dependent hydrolase (beta-lactamase superfamily II)